MIVLKPTYLKPKAALVPFHVPKPKPKAKKTAKAVPKVKKVIRIIPKQTATKKPYATTQRPQKITASGQTRELNEQELKRWTRILSLLKEERKETNLALNRGRICRDLQKRLDLMGYLDPTIWTAKDTANMEAAARSANAIERIHTNLQRRQWFLRNNPSFEQDFEVVSLTKPALEGIGNPVIFVATTAAFVIIGAFAVAITYMITQSKKASEDYGNRLLKADQWAAQQNPKIQAAYKAFRNAKENAGFWPEAKSAMKNILLLGLGLLAIYFLGSTGVSAIRQYRSERAEDREQREMKRRTPYLSIPHWQEYQ